MNFWFFAPLQCIRKRKSHCAIRLLLDEVPFTANVDRFCNRHILPLHLLFIIITTNYLTSFAMFANNRAKNNQNNSSKRRPIPHHFLCDLRGARQQNNLTS
jgi:hypothetical protein